MAQSIQSGSKLSFYRGLLIFRSVDKDRVILNHVDQQEECALIHVGHLAKWLFWEVFEVMAKKVLQLVGDWTTYKVLCMMHNFRLTQV